ELAELLAHGIVKPALRRHPGLAYRLGSRGFTHQPANMLLWRFQAPRQRAQPNQRGNYYAGNDRDDRRNSLCFGSRGNRSTSRGNRDSRRYSCGRRRHGAINLAQRLATATAIAEGRSVFCLAIWAAHRGVVSHTPAQTKKCWVTFVEFGTRTG